LRFKRLALVLGALLALAFAFYPKQTAETQVWLSGPPDEGGYARVTRFSFLYDQRHHKCASVYTHREINIIVHVCEYPVSHPSGFMQGPNGEPQS
jgi:hypothetical protein